ncbi:hypothetical protein C1H46_040996 [Malus baccata]|uniref:Uncharacterized protein n=1 Tax=Malus baccata TaxID=106549 RepID=A0A540KGW3_MALBA|nr:hypothetical protein C1H46_040996 [Malus baccata]
MIPTGDGVIVLGRSKKNAIRFQNLLTKRFDGRWKTLLLLALQIRVQKWQFWDVYVLNFQAADRRLA